MPPASNVSVIGPSGNIKPIPIYHAIPPVSNAIYKIVIDTDGGEIDITDFIVKATFNIGVASSKGFTSGDFVLRFLDPGKTNHDLISLFDDVYLYSDYGASATTKRFRFKVEDRGFIGHETTLKGKGIGMILSNKSINYRTLDDDGNITTKTRSEILTEILEDNFSEITDFSEIESDDTSVEKNYSETPFSTIIEELCGEDKYFYLDKDLVPHYFTKGSVKNELEAVADSNLIEILDNSENAEEVYSKVRVYGTSEDNLPTLYTKNIGTTNTKGITKDYVISNNSIRTNLQAQTFADYEGDRVTSASLLGEFSVLYLPTLGPGEGIFMGVPDRGVNPGYYNIKDFTIEFDNESEFSQVTKFIVEGRKRDTPKIVKQMLQTQEKLKSTYNPNDLDYSKIITFDEDIGTHDGTGISEDYLKVSGGSQGTWTSPIYTLDSNLSAIEIRWTGDYLIGDYLTTSALLFFSLNGGRTWKTYLIGDESFTGTIPAGKDLRLKVVLNDSQSKVKKIGVYYKY